MTPRYTCSIKWESGLQVRHGILNFFSENTIYMFMFAHEIPVISLSPGMSEFYFSSLIICTFLKKYKGHHQWVTWSIFQFSNNQPNDLYNSLSVTGGWGAVHHGPGEDRAKHPSAPFVNLQPVGSGVSSECLHSSSLSRDIPVCQPPLGMLEGLIHSLHTVQSE